MQSNRLLTGLSGAFILLTFILLAAPLYAQVEARKPDPVAVRIPSHGVTMAGTVHVGAGPTPRHTVLFVPGFASRGREVLGLGAALSDGGVNVVMFAPRGWHDSEGVFTGTNAIEDTRAAFDWLRDEETVRRFGVDTTRITVGGYSFGAATALAHAARDPRVRRVFSIAAPDHYAISRHDEVRPWLNEALTPVWAPEGPLRPAAPGGPEDPGGVWREFLESPELFSLPLLAPGLRDRSVLLISGLHDGESWVPEMPQLDHMHLPLYRALRAGDAVDIGFRLFIDEHAFAASRSELAEALLGWLRACETETPCGGYAPQARP
jgi:pimeloyl-ACP methyl ester carboxylesterase